VAALLLLCGTLLPGIARADAGRWLNSPSYAELSQEVAALQGPDGGPAAALSAAQQQRLADLTVLEQAIAASDDRSQVRNTSSHNLALFSLFKKARTGSAPQLGVLAPGHESDDDFSIAGLYIPAGVSLEWADGGTAAAASTARVLRLPEGEVLTVSDALAEPATADATDPAAASSEAVTLQLSLPPFSLAAALPEGGELPTFSQADLDSQIETAPVD
jgi:hypothetical protein